MIYDLKKETDKSRFKRRCNELFEAGKVVELTEKKEKRTIRQNRYLHLILGWYGIETGNTVDYVKENYFKRLCNPALFVTYKEDKHLGQVEVLRSSSGLDTGEMTLAIERFRTWSAMECNIYLPDPEDLSFLREIEIELERYRQWI